MMKYEVWDKVDQPEETNIVGCRWVFWIKSDSSGKILKYRTRLVAQGFTQLYGVDFYETFTPVARLSSIRAVIALAASENWELHQMDVKSAYLNSPIDTAIYMRLPPGYNHKGKVACVKKGIYGLHQSGNLWHKTLTIAFNKLDLTRSAVDHGVFYRHDNKGTTIVCSSTDDFAITVSSPEHMVKFKSAIELVKNATFYSRTKHITIRYHYICEAYNEGAVVLDHCGTDDMPADVFTKALDCIKLNKFALLVGLSQT